MRHLILTAMLALSALSAAEAYAQSQTALEDGVGAGGAGGNPNAMGIQSISGSRHGAAKESSGGLSIMGLPESPSSTSGVQELIIKREEMLKAVDAALNSTDLEMEINNRLQTVRPLKFDLSRGILQGKVLETSRTIRLIDETGAGTREP